MKKTPKLIITCRHDESDHITTGEGETVCKCGVVLEERMPDLRILKSESTPTLYHQVEMGGSPRDMKVVNKKIHIHSSSASEFSNICSKLNLPNFAQQGAWSMYHTLRGSTCHTRAKCAILSLYVTCRESGLPNDESKILQAVTSVLCVKSTPGVLAVISELHEDALRLGIDTNKGHSPRYYLNLAISKMQHKIGYRREYDRFVILATSNFGYLTGSNPKSRAERAVAMTLAEMGLN